MKEVVTDVGALFAVVVGPFLLLSLLFGDWTKRWVVDPLTELMHRLFTTKRSPTRDEAAVLTALQSAFEP